MSYSLSEAYADLYNPRKAEENALFYDNLRFVDYLSQEDIQEVMESLLWEFIDYGNTLDESYDLISDVFSDSILEEVLCETKELYLDEGIGSAIQRLGGKIERGEQRVGQFAARQRQRAGSAASAAREFGSTAAEYGSAQQQKLQRNLQARKAQVQGGLSAARKAITSAPGAVKRAVTGAAVSAGQAVGGQIGRAKAALGGFVRKGVRKVAQAGIGLGGAISKSGENAYLKNVYSARGTTPIRQERVGKAYGTSRRERLGKAITGASQQLRKLTPSAREMLQQRSLTQTPSDPTYKSLRGQPRQRPAAPESMPVAAPELVSRGRRMGATVRGAARGELRPRPAAADRPGRNVERQQLRGSEGRRGTPTPVNPAALARGTRQSRQLPQTTRMNQGYYTNVRGRNRAAVRREDVAYEILNTLVEQGYAQDYNNAAVILENLSDNMLYTLIQEYQY